VRPPRGNPRLDEQPSLPEKVIVIHEAFGGAKVPYALGGALALAYYAEPRATIDIDVNVFLPAERWRDAVDVLDVVGVDCSELEPAAVERNGQCRLWWGDNPVDLFFAYDSIHDEMRKQTRRVPFAGIAVPILGPEHLAVCKAMFDRRKDWLDIEQMLIATDDLDVSEVEGWLARMVGAEDARVKRLQELKATAPEEAG
jgi:hypothetical protein